jgi:hypothetical protein
MKKRIATAVLSAGMFFGAPAPHVAVAAARHHSHARYDRHRRRRKTLKRVGIGAAGGAAVGALAGGAPGAGIGAIAGGAGGYLYDRHKKHGRGR